jgi:hypothetical protein
MADAGTSHEKPVNGTDTDVAGSLLSSRIGRSCHALQAD